MKMEDLVQLVTNAMIGGLENIRFEIDREGHGEDPIIRIVGWMK